MGFHASFRECKTPEPGSSRKEKARDDAAETLLAWSNAISRQAENRI